MLPRRPRTLAFTVILLLAVLGAIGCADDVETEGTVTCQPNERRNPITGQCVPITIGPNLDAGADDSGPPNPFLDAAADVSEDDYCSDELDSDLDGLLNACECTLGTDPARPDTDRDGRLDGEEDANADCVLGAGETDARRDDTDSDGLIDGDEIDAGTDPLTPDTDGDGILDGAEAHSCLDPLSEDSDGDGIPDAVEDANLDGELGQCEGRVYAPECAQGESDPCATDTDGDGTADGEEAQYLGCRPEDTANLTTPQLLSASGRYQLAAEPGVSAASVTGLSGASAHALDDATSGYAAFVASLPRPSGANSLPALSARVLSAAGARFGAANQRATGRRIVTHDGHPATVGAIVELSGGLRASAVRDGLLAQLAGVGSVSHGAGGSFQATASGDPMLLVYQILDRGGSDYIITAAAVPESDYLDLNGSAGPRVDDLTGGAALASASEALEADCVSYQVQTRPKVDFIWVLDASGSMGEEMNQVKAFASQFASILQASNLDWRIGVTSGTCSNIAADPAISPEIGQLFGEGFFSSCPGIPVGNIPIKNGILCSKNGANFTDDPAKFSACIDDVANQFASGEFVIGMGAAAIDRALPRSETDSTKLRPDAAVVVISVTDEFDQYVEDKMSWRDASDPEADPHDPTLASGFDSARLENVIAPFVDYFLKPEIGATVFGIYWIPGQGCPGAAEAAAGLDRVVQQTGGTAGSVCQSDITATLQEIATASAGIASGLRLRGIPAPPSIEVNLGQVSTGNILELPRSLADGWNYDAIVNRVTFQGPNPPQTGDRVVIPYLRWAGSVRACQTDADCPQEQKYICVDGECL